jgi:hypothetical protein
MELKTTANRQMRPKSAIKSHRATEFYLRERAVYERLSGAGVSDILGFHVPQFIRADDDLQVIVRQLDGADDAGGERVDSAG